VVRALPFKLALAVLQPMAPTVDEGVWTKVSAALLDAADSESTTCALHCQLKLALLALALAHSAVSTSALSPLPVHCTASWHWHWRTQHCQCSFVQTGRFSSRLYN
jgi:hypothetical protein